MNLMTLSKKECLLCNKQATNSTLHLCESHANTVETSKHHAYILYQAPSILQRVLWACAPFSGYSPRQALYIEGNPPQRLTMLIAGMSEQCTVLMDNRNNTLISFNKVSRLGLAMAKNMLEDLHSKKEPS